tara:strand:+ start:2055 stop:2762 length:708 start_codon:yes stop_codon:yes gene_type:complete
VSDLVVALLSVTLTAVATAWFLSLRTDYFIKTIGLYVAVATLLLANIPNTLSGPGLGHANRITLLRTTLIVPIAAMITIPVTLNTTGAWWIITISAIALMLDGLDGRVSRIKQCETTFGAKFDMELDAFFLFILSVLVWQSGKIGVWITAIGIIRYAFVISTLLAPWLGQTLPESFRRKLICAIQGISLLICLGPIVPPTFAALVGGVALCLLVISFGIDIQWLTNHREAIRSTD